jgi:hypothetical protein
VGEREAVNEVVARLHEALKAAKLSANVRLARAPNHTLRLILASRETGDRLKLLNAIVAEILNGSPVEHSYIGPRDAAVQFTPAASHRKPQ